MTNSDSGEAVESGTFHELILMNHKIRETEHWLKIAKTRRKWSNLSLAFGPLLGLLLYAMGWLTVIPWKAREAIYIPGAPAAVLLIAATFWLKTHPGHPGKLTIGKKRAYTSEGELEISLARLREERKEIVGKVKTNRSVRRIIYKEEAFASIDQLRSESSAYRRINNALQGVLIIGSLAATGAAGLATQLPWVRWAVMALTFLVGISSGFMGYFKYKERSFYLQQTADAIEQEWEAVEVHIGRYKNSKTDEDALEEFVEEVHRLKTEQKKRQQNLEQPSDARESAD